MFKVLLLAFFLLMGLQGHAAQTAQAQQVIRLATFPIPLMVENENSGIFVELLQAIEARIPYRIELSVYPTKRTLHLFENNKVDGYFPALDVVINVPFQRSENIYEKEDFAFVKQGSDVPTSIASLNNKHIGLTSGYPYVAEIAEAADKVSYAVNDYANVLKLEAGRIDVFIGEEKSGLQAIKASHLDSIIYNPTNPLSEQDVYFAFQDSAQGKVYADHFSQALNELKQDGTFARLMAKAGK